uniref:protein-tyrosine sulfotransferase n=1 Tax=Octactis speculum TaxID=3111310 RepID=A0A7S2FHL6_9STRA|mmetsp:Transcript_21833/g.29688  ORF Transcript_21833/g.29688 Transcript_21833/m.29688 type:complete len:394 (+) Transcript_21833:1124-2305(+)
MRANAVEASRRPSFNAATELQSTATYQAVFQEGFWPVGSDEETPVFVIGLMRSGSTLVEAILSSHSKVVDMGEDSVFNGMLPEIREKIVKSISKGDINGVLEQVEAAASKVVHHMQLKFPDNSSSMATYIVDKMLFNFKNVGFIHLVFPKARIIHCVRSFWDVLFSCYKHKFEDSGLEWSLSIEHIVSYFVAYRRLMRHWETVLPGRIFTVQYEELVASPREVVQRMLEHCNLEWEEQVMDFHRSKDRVVLTHSALQVRTGIYKHSVGRVARYRRLLEAEVNKVPLFLNELSDVVADENKVNWVINDSRSWQQQLSHPQANNPKSAITPPLSSAAEQSPAASSTGGLRERHAMAPAVVVNRGASSRYGSSEFLPQMTATPRIPLMPGRQPSPI